MECREARLLLHDLERGRVPAEQRRPLEEHLRECASCARAVEAERVLSSVLEQRLPRHPAPPELKARLAALVAPAAAPTAAAALAVAWGAFLHAAARLRWARLAAPALAMAMGLLIGALVLGRGAQQAHPPAPFTAEAVSDHLRMLVSAHPLDVTSGSHHEVKPWFEGRLDFAPAVPVPAVPDLRLEGGGVGYFLDRKAALVRYAVRRHAVTMIAFSAQGLPWPPGGTSRLDGTDSFQASDRGFHVVFWRAGGLCYALVSDMNAAELHALAARLAAST